MFHEYKHGRTPNPDILCNREIKFDEFLKATAQFNPDYIATGHYCRKDTIEKNEKPVYRLLVGKDSNKEQSYFLCQVSQKQLSKILFPIGHLEKSRVRKIATDHQLPTAQKKDSQGICFIGKVDLPTFLQQKLEPKQGDVIEIPRRFGGYLQYDPKNNDPVKLSKPFKYQPDDGIIIGKHRGAHFFTIGQRKGLTIGGKKEPLFVIATDTRKNIVYTGEGHMHPGLYRKGLFIQGDDIHWIREDLQMNPGEEKKLLVRIRYRQPLQKASLITKDKGMYIIFERMQRGITPGQFAAWYDGEELLGSGCIS
jgi:tRNA-specific 2-thiouridylase